jgi:hypothetical protein
LAYQVTAIGLPPRAKVNLADAVRIIDKKGSSPQPDIVESIETSHNMVVFPKEYEAYQCVENGFRIRFANGETIDFGADSAKEKETLLNVLNGIIGKPAAIEKRTTGIKSWCQIVLDKEQKDKEIKANVNM